MEMPKLNATETLKRLHDEDLVTFKKASFSEAVAIGKIPFTLNNKGKKRYDYKEVVKAIADSGIGRPPKTLENITEPTVNQSPQEYGEQAVAELGAKPTLTDANIFKTLYAGKLEKLKYEIQRGEVILRTEVEDKAFSVSRAIRDKILTMPERLSNELASINDAHQIKELLYKEFGLLLDGFSEKSFV